MRHNGWGREYPGIVLERRSCLPILAGTGLGTRYPKRAGRTAHLALA